MGEWSGLVIRTRTRRDNNRYSIIRNEIFLVLLEISAWMFVAQRLAKGDMPLGGQIILNSMPCVFPTGEEQAKRRKRLEPLASFTRSFGNACMFRTMGFRSGERTSQ
jgi:hypothetical protein